MADAATNGFVETEIGPLPRNWGVGPLGDYLASTQYGLSLRGEQSGRFPILRMNNLQCGAITTDSLQYVDLDEAEFAKFRLQFGDILFNRTNSFELVGKTSLFNQTADFVFASYLIRLKCVNEVLNPEFLNFWMNSQNAQTRLKQLATRGVSQSNINATKLKGLVLPVPPLEEQRAIAGVLRTVQRAKEATEKVIAVARQLKQSLMRHLFTYGPVPIQEAEQVKLQETDFGESPRHWATELLNDCCAVQTGAAKGRRFGDDETVELPYLRVANVQGGYLDLKEMKTITIRKREIERYSLQDGDVVLTEGGDFDKLGRGFIWRNEIPGCLHQNHVFAVRANRIKLLPEFVAHQTQSEYGRAYFLSVAHRTTNLACINTTKLKAFPMLIPPLSEQREIEANLDAVDKKLAQEEQKHSALSALFDSLLHGLMTGRIRTTVDETPGGS